jgi:integration host factor subunit beta
MLRSDLIDLLTQRNPHLSSATVEQAVKMLLEHMSETLAADGRIEIRGFGSFNVRKRPARLARNPKTGASVPVREHGRVHFKPGLELRDRIHTAFLNSLAGD